MKNLIRRIFGNRKATPESELEAPAKPIHSRSLELDALEPRVLFSAAPVEAPADADDSETVQVPDAASDDGGSGGGDGDD